MNCIKCGKEITPGTEACSYCGEPALEEVPEETEETQDNTGKLTVSGSDLAITPDAPANDHNEKNDKPDYGVEESDPGLETDANKKKSGKKKIIIGFSIIALIIVSLAVSILMVKILPERRLKSLLSLGEKYLSEMNYEDAIAAFEEALQIDPKTEDAYIGIANVYIGLKDYKKALDAIERGISVLGETDKLLELRTQIEELMRQQEQEEAEKLTAQGDSTTPASAEDWSFDLYDILRYDVFGKDVSEWTQADFEAYLEANGYASTDFDSEEPQYAAGLRGGGVSFCGGDIEIEYGPSHIWSVSKRSFSPEIETSGTVLHYDFPSLDQITEKAFLERLPSEVGDLLSQNYQNAFFTNGRCYRMEGSIDKWCVYYPDEASPEMPVRMYVFELENHAYCVAFSSDSGELIQISEEEPMGIGEDAAQRSTGAGPATADSDTDITVYVEGCDFRNSHWGDTVDDISKSEADWAYFEACDSTDFPGCKYYSRTFEGKYGFSQVLYYFDEDGKLFQGTFSTATLDANEAVDNFNELVDDFDGKFGYYDYRLVNCDDDTLKEKLEQAEGCALAGWQLGDSTRVIVSVIPSSPLYFVEIGYFKQDAPHNREKGVYKIWNDLSPD